MAQIIAAPQDGNATLTQPVPAERSQRVLVVDDNLEAAVMLSLVLRRMGYEVLTADNGEDGLGWGEKASPDFVMLDLGMPGMDGFEMCRTLRGTTWGARATVIAITGHGEAEDRRRSKEAGFDFHLVKPVDAALLGAVLSASAADQPGR